MKKKMVNPVQKNDVEQQPKMRTVMIASPSYDGKVNVWHASALTETCKIGLTKGINIICVYMSYDALVQRARNDIFKLALDSKVDDLFFIDCDIDWNPNDFFRMLEHDVSVVAAPVVKKSDMEQYNVKMTEKFIIEDNGLAVVDGVGTGFMRIRSDIIQKVWDVSVEYNEPHKEQPIRMVFEVKIANGMLQSEDISFCEKVMEIGEKVYIDPLIICGHSGEKRWIGNFYQWTKLFSRG